MKNLLTIILYLFVASSVNAADSTQKKNFEKILGMEKGERLKNIMDLFYDRYYFSSDYDAGLDLALDSLKKYQVAETPALIYFAQSLIVRRKQDFIKAEQLLLKAINWAEKGDNLYLLASLHTTLAFAQTGKGDVLGALHSYRLARNEAEKLKDKRRIISSELGIADIYRTLQLYNHAIFYLDQAGLRCTGNNPYDQKMTFAISKTKADVFFAMQKADSVKLYYNKALTLNKPDYNSKRELMRLNYYVLILSGRYDEAIPLIKQVLDPNVKYFRHIDRLNLAESYFKINDHKSAVSVIEHVVADSMHAYSYIKIHSYKLLGEIALSKGLNEEALRYQNLGLIEAEKSIKNMTEVSDLSFQIRLDQMEVESKAQASLFKKERTILVFGLLATALGAIIIGLFYNSIRQKSKYEKLLADSKTRELSFLNSHKTRKPLANILGFCNLARESDSPKSDLLTYFEYIAISAAELDEWVKEVDKKLKED
ncbi:tetratricopeptide repeat protein [Niabella ginsengisoli]|uniref:Tetratricopeptide repeat protein n=1 Tax=Niabella ginsengisoli TaxID=522298 RepID=A0ABS9SDX4_9BACT|nr:hypothetical protein [Niabella ginsengisoli]MCH5596553.1 hypothetical protein [Niabella ginsengisoli]